MDDDKLRQDAARGRRARELLEDGLLAETFAALEADSITGWKQTQPYGALEMREAFYHDVRALERLKGRLSRYVADGRLAERELNDLSKRKP